ncbi:MAG: SAF domain-containing protein, partial [Bacteroidota bacterium]
MSNRSVIVISLANLLILFASIVIMTNLGNSTLGEHTNEEIEIVPFSNSVLRDDEAPRATDIPTIPVVIAVQNIPRGTVISRDVVDVILFPGTSVPDGAYAEVNDVIGSIAVTDIFAEELILARKLASDYTEVSTGSNVNSVIHPDRVSVTLYIPQERVVSGLQSGDNINLIYSFVENGRDRSFVIPFARVVWLGPVPDRLFEPLPTSTPVVTPDPAARPTTSINNQDNVRIQPTITYGEVDELGNVILTLAVFPQDAVTIDWATNQELPVRVVGLSANTRGIFNVIPVNFDNVLEIYGQVTPTPTP